MQKTLRDIAAALCLVAGASLPGRPGMANPNGPAVVHGQASFSTQGTTLTVTNTPGAIIHWQGFSIRPDELTRFLQQSPVSSVLNRVVGGSPSEILGRLSSNGRVFVINPSGILIGPDARIDVAGLVASTLDISNADFIAGRLRFSSKGADAPIENRGAIVTPAGGRVVLVGARVDNSGLVQAPSGEIVLAAGRSVTLGDTAFPGILVEVTAPADTPLSLGRLEEGRGRPFSLVVRNSGTISTAAAAGGRGGDVVLNSAGTVELATAANVDASGVTGGRVAVKAAERVITAARIEARGALEGGSVVIDALQDLALAGSVTVSGGTRGGSVTVRSGGSADLPPSARIDARGALEGGSVVVEALQDLALAGSVDVSGTGGAGGQVTTASGGSTVMAAAGRILANGGGHGGRVTVKAEQTATFAGVIEARGGDAGGDGGQVEVSGRTGISIAGTVDTRAPAGDVGTFVIDPTNIDIVPAAVTAGVTPANLADGTWSSAEDAGRQTVSADVIANLLAITSVRLEATQRITVAARTEIAPQLPAARTLTLAAPAIEVDGGVRAAGAPLEVKLQAPEGSVRVSEGARIELNGGALRVDAKQVAVQSALPSARPVEVAVQRAQAAPDTELARMRAEVEAEIARDAARVAASLRSCREVGAYRQGCAIGGPEARRFTFAGA